MCLEKQQNENRTGSCVRSSSCSSVQSLQLTWCVVVPPSSLPVLPQFHWSSSARPLLFSSASVVVGGREGCKRGVTAGPVAPHRSRCPHSSAHFPLSQPDSAPSGLRVFHPLSRRRRHHHLTPSLPVQTHAYYVLFCFFLFCISKLLAYIHINIKCIYFS